MKRTQEEGFEITSFSSALKATLRLILKPGESRSDRGRFPGSMVLRSLKLLQMKSTRSYEVKAKLCCER